MLSGKLAHLYRSGPRLVNILRVLWVAAIVWFELGTFTYHVSQCAWPETLPAADHVRSLSSLARGATYLTSPVSAPRR